MNRKIPWFYNIKTRLQDMTKHWRRTKSPYIAIGLLFLAGLWNYHQFLKNGGLQEREIPAHYVRPRTKRSNMTSVRHAPKPNPPHLHNSTWICSPEQRIANLHAACHKHRNLFLNTRITFGNQFIVDDKRKIVYCQVPHVGSYSLKKVLMSINANHSFSGSGYKSGNPPAPMGDWSHGLEAHGLTHMARLLPRYSQYRKFLIVRNPFDRILSVYNSIVQNAHKIDTSAKDYIRAIYNTGQDLSPLTLENFIKFLTESTAPRNVYNNPHWRAIVDTCFPCHIKYNRIIKLETIKNDADFFRQLNILGSDVPHLNKAQKSYSLNSMGANVLSEFYRISWELISKLKHRYRLDMDIFGYRFDTKLSKADCKPPSNLQTGYECC